MGAACRRWMRPPPAANDNDDASHPAARHQTQRANPPVRCIYNLWGDAPKAPTERVRTPRQAPVPLRPRRHAPLEGPQASANSATPCSVAGVRLKRSQGGKNRLECGISAESLARICASAVRPLAIRGKTPGRAPASGIFRGLRQGFRRFERPGRCQCTALAQILARQLRKIPH